MTEAVSVGDSPKLRIAFDVTRLFQARVRNSGISRYVRELLAGMALRADCAVFPFRSDEQPLCFFEPGPDSVAALLRGEEPARTEWPEPLDICFSPVDPLPPRDDLGLRIVEIYDVIHAKYPAFTADPAAAPPIESTLASVRPHRDFVIAPSLATKRDLLSILDIDEERIAVIPAGLSAAFLAPPAELSEDGAPPLVAALLQFDPRKNVERGLTALAQALARHQTAMATLVSAAPAEQLHEAIARHGLPATRCNVLSAPDDAALAALYARADLFLYVPLVEGFGLPPLEAMACGCPAVVSATSSLPEAVGPHAAYVDPTSVEDILRGLDLVLSNPDYRRILARAGRGWAQGFTWEACVDRTVAFFHAARLKSRQSMLRVPGVTIGGKSVEALVQEADRMGTPTRNRNDGPRPSLPGWARKGRLGRLVEIALAGLGWWADGRKLLGLGFVAALLAALFGVPGANWAALAIALIGFVAIPYATVRARQQAANRARTPTIKDVDYLTLSMARRDFSRILAIWEKRRGRSGRP